MSLVRPALALPGNTQPVNSFNPRLSSMAASGTGGFKSKAPPPPLRLHSSTFSSSSNGRSPSATHQQTTFDTTNSGASTPTANHRLLYELPPSSSSPKIRGSRENSRTRQTNYRRMHSLGGQDGTHRSMNSSNQDSHLYSHHGKPLRTAMTMKWNSLHHYPEITVRDPSPHRTPIPS